MEDYLDKENAIGFLKAKKMEANKEKHNPSHSRRKRVMILPLKK